MSGFFRSKYWKIFETKSHILRLIKQKEKFVSSYKKLQKVTGQMEIIAV